MNYRYEYCQHCKKITTQRNDLPEGKSKEYVKKFILTWTCLKCGIVVEKECG